jgi:hypothetical protein
VRSFSGSTLLQALGAEWCSSCWQAGSRRCVIQGKHKDPYTNWRRIRLCINNNRQHTDIFLHINDKLIAVIMSRCQYVGLHCSRMSEFASCFCKGLCVLPVQRKMYRIPPFKRGNQNANKTHYALPFWLFITFPFLAEYFTAGCILSIWTKIVPQKRETRQV